MPRAPAAERNRCERIESDRLCGVADIEIAHVVRAAARDAVDDALGEVAVRVDDRDALARLDIGHRDIEEGRRLPRPALPDDVDVALRALRGVKKMPWPVAWWTAIAGYSYFIAPGQPPVRYHGAVHRWCLAVMRPEAYLWRSARARLAGRLVC